MANNIKRLLLLLLTGTLLALAIWSSFNIYQNSARQGEIKKDYSTVNSITYGLLSVNTWKDHLTNMVMNRVDEFEFTEAQEDTLVKQVGNILTAGLDKGEALIDQKQKGVKAKLRKFAVKTLVPEEKIRALVPVFAQTIVTEIQKTENKDALKFVIKEKIQEYSDMTHANSIADIKLIDSLMQKYEVRDLEEFNKKNARRLLELEEDTYFYTYFLLGIILVFSLLWALLRNYRFLHTPLFIISVLVALVVLFTGITAPMIEIDARFQQVNFMLIGEEIVFKDQVIFFQSKSILDVISILFKNGKIDSAFVGLLILVFSIIFPVAKLISTQIYLGGSDRIRKNKILKFLTFKSGKWSMADVYVIAVFMAYIGFQGILDNQLANLNRDNDALMSISTNRTSLQPGFIIFIGFVLFSLFLSSILKWITKKTKIKEDKLQN